MALKDPSFTPETMHLEGPDFWESPQHIIDWAREVEPPLFSSSPSKTESDKFVADWLAQCVRVANGVREVLDQEQLDATDM